MVGPAGKTPRHKLTAAENQLCLEALRRERRIRRAQEKEEMARQGARGLQKKKAVKETDPAEAKTVTRTEGAEEAIRDATAADATESVAEVLSAMGATVVSETTTGEARTTEADCGRPAEQVTISGNRKRRRRILQVESCKDIEDLSRDEDGIEPAVPAIAGCVVDDDPNLMNEGAEEGTGLNSDEDTDVREEPEDEDDDGVDDGWDGDWDIGYLTDEEPDKDEDLPDSVWLSAAKDKKLVSVMRQNGWEYDPTMCGPDPTYAEFVLRVADDPLALSFYFMPPKLCTQIALESNSYHTQSIPQRARTIRSQQRGEVEDIGEIRRRLVNVADIEPWEILRVIALLTARMLVPIRKGIAAHWSLKKVGALPANRFGQFMAKNRFFHIMGYLHFLNSKHHSLIQICYKTRKNYKTLFLGLLDMTLVNAFIVHRYHKKISNKRPPKHFAFFEGLLE
ncbi:Hypothetical protein PHPALM_1113 [Phytophthora palmivora]|uniref:PiggyBac transposable element-derived protein domain-containing protein n=1 Tax=Phytophthora palmivora TaxID=4796 RepID=A0A2P4YT67_9STRA|nr:Hypothetical protein PHPALM_1113 [Phytophthora palmivora]